MKSSAPTQALIKQTAQLQQRKFRLESGHILVEGKHPIEEAVQAGLKLIHWFALSEANPAQLPTISSLPLPYAVTEKQMQQMASTQTAPPCLAVFEIPSKQAPEQFMQQTRQGLLLVLDDIQDPGNMGTLIRSAKAFGATGLLITPNCADPYQPKVIRASTGLVFSLPILSQPLPEIIKLLSQQARAVYLTSGQADAQHYTSVAYEPASALVLGNEGQGVSAEWKQLPEALLHRITIPMCSGVESLNVGVSGSIILAEAAKRAGRC